MGIVIFFSSAIFLTALVVKYPSVVSSNFKCSSILICCWLAIKLPKVVLRDFKELHVSTKSPRPDNQNRVSGFAFKTLPMREISTYALAIKALLAFSPRFRPIVMPAAIA